MTEPTNTSAPAPAPDAHGHAAEVPSGPPKPLGEWIKTGQAKQYLTIFGWLVVFTVLEIGATFLKVDKKTLAAILIGTAVIKASIVAAFFMHLLHEVKLILWTVFTPVVIAIVFLLILFPDIVIGPRSALP